MGAPSYDGRKWRLKASGPVRSGPVAVSRRQSPRAVRCRHSADSSSSSSSNNRSLIKAAAAAADVDVIMSVAAVQHRNRRRICTTVEDAVNTECRDYVINSIYVTCMLLLTNGPAAFIIIIIIIVMHL